ncbi:LysR family transcriptional regulator [Kitasatospora cheerisanensis]|uniref:LysR family transcriptional regulator n=1 Tax=Kitasatospora cheerisanensis KCTC 2395 TaxID=1348663 RepID=A0A066YUQ1_9ACTN|nr:LysR family transcriptional regulator [Kitasatospora cheerisanensis]KDN81826.1 LysR family transcriptional regulator [Kitasatospora cheerisanensis KCTC 2395]
MELRQMEVVVAVAEAGGFTAAARRLHVVQSAVSGTVRALEKELGVQLFERTTHRVALTPAGEAFVPAARNALRAAELARSAADEARGVLRGVLTIGTMQGVWLGLDRVLAELRTEHPGLTIRLHQAAAADIRTGLRDGTVDAAVVAFDRQQQRGLTVRSLACEPMVLAASPARAFAHRDRVRYDELAALPFVDFAPGWAVRAAVDRAFRAAAAERTPAFEVNDIVAAAELVRHDLGVCILPESIAARFPDLALRRFTTGQPRWDIAAVHPSGTPSPPVAALLRHLG